MKKNNIATLLLTISTLFWGMTFVFIKEGVAIVAPYTFLAWRFFIAAFSLIIIFYRRLRQFDLKIIVYGTMLGIVLAGGYLTQTIGIQHTTASKAAFITGLLVVWVPLMLAAINRRLPGIHHVAAVVVAIIGLALLTLQSPLSLNSGDVWVFFCAIFFAWHIILIGKYTKIFEPLKFTIIQLITVALISGTIAIIKGQMVIPEGYLVWQAILFCAVFATSFTYMVQNHFQKYISEVKAAIIFAFEPLFAAITAYFYLHEEMSWRIIGGGLLIFIGMLISEIRIFSNIPIKRMKSMKKNDANLT